MQITPQNHSGLQNRTAQGSKREQPTVAKYIVLQWNGREQVTAFPFQTQHADMLNYIRRESPEVQAISAGFFIADGDTLWVGGQSDTLKLTPRPQDEQLIRAFLTSPDRAEWDLTLLAAEAGQTISR